jgi:hypothetical protein
MKNSIKDLEDQIVKFEASQRENQNTVKELSA